MKKTQLFKRIFLILALSLSFCAFSQSSRPVVSDIEASTLSTNMWDHADVKVRRLWPNAVPTDNHAAFSPSFDFNLNFCSPGVAEGRIR
jgi:hypothetical protein